MEREIYSSIYIKSAVGSGEDINVIDSVQSTENLVNLFLQHGFRVEGLDDVLVRAGGEGGRCLLDPLRLPLHNNCSSYQCCGSGLGKKTDPDP